MKLDDLKSLLSEHTQSKDEAGKMLNKLGEALGDALSKGEEVTLPGIGKFSTSVRAARQGRNPQTGATIQIAEKRVIKFKAAKTLSDKVAG